MFGFGLELLGYMLVMQGLYLFPHCLVPGLDVYWCR